MSWNSQLLYAGVEVYTGRRFETTCHVHVIDLAHAQIKLTRGFMSVPERAKQMGAELAFNGNGWGLQPAGTGLSNEYLVIEGVVIQATAIDYRPCMNISRDGMIEFLERPNFQTAWNVIGFDRFIAQDGIYNSRITNNFPDPRTVYGVDIFGCLIILVCEGRRVNEKGLTFAECWSVMQEFGAIDCGNADGGYSSCAYNKKFGLMNKTYEAEYRQTVMQVLFYANELGDYPPETGENEMIATVVTKARFRSTNSILTNDTGAESVVGFQFVPANQLPDKNNSSIPMVQVPSDAPSVGAGKWLPVRIGTTEYTRLSEQVPDPDPIDPPLSKAHIEIVIDDTITVTVNDKVFKEQ